MLTREINLESFLIFPIITVLREGKCKVDKNSGQEYFSKIVGRARKNVRWQK
jgi:translation initiation factor IF-1